jgi:predicted glycosyltransferase
MPAGFRFLTPVVRKLHQMVISNYTYCWIPDEPGTFNLSGNLSHNQILPENARFIGILSRFQRETFSIEAEKQYDFLFILSGVEPQRTILEEKIISLFQENSSYKAVLVRGISCEKESIEQVKQLTIINQVSEKELKLLLETSEVVVCRSGYTSIMELASLSKRAVLIPTPGQPEQEYLAEYLSSFPLFSCVKQDEFTFSRLLLAAESTKSHSPSFSFGLLTKAIQELNK